jgi:periplasmic divalent cation tolerance protein
MTEKIVILSTCGSETEAHKLARLLVDTQLAACVNVIGGGVLGGVRSFYRWQGKVESASEWLLLIKTSRDRFARVQAAIEDAHSYEVPEIIALPIVEGAPAYLSWMDENLGTN